jgi:hypothetical protein
MSKVSVKAAEVNLDEVITKTVQTDITGYTINETASLTFNKSLTIIVTIFSNDKMVERKRMTLIDEDFSNFMKEGRNFLDIYVKNTIING